MFLINSRCSRFSVATGPFLDSQVQWHPLSRSYGVILPSSFTRVLSSALGFSPRLPVLVLVRAPTSLPARIFLETSQTTCTPRREIQVPPLAMSPRICLRLGLGSHATNPTVATPALLTSRPPSDQSSAGGVRILTHCPSPTPFGLGLGPD